VKGCNEEGTTLLKIVLSAVCTGLSDVFTESEERHSEKCKVSWSQRENLKVVESTDQEVLTHSHEEKAFTEHQNLQKCEEEGQMDDHEMIEF